MVLTSIMLVSCAKSKEGDEDVLGSIYGIVAELGTAEPMRAMGVELYKSDKLLLKTVTFDDGHFEFVKLSQGDYQVKVVSDEYEQTEKGLVTVEAGRQARIDLQVRKLVFKNHMVVRTTESTSLGLQVTLNGEYLYEDAQYAPSEVGFVYSTYHNPSNGGTRIKSKVNNETKIFSAKIEGLSNVTYYVQAYAKNKIGTEYGEVRSFVISNIPVVTTLFPTNIMPESATLNGQIEYEGDPAYSERGFVYSTTFHRPTIDDPIDATKRVPVSGKNNEFRINISSLIENSVYYIRAYATYDGGVVYGDVLTFIPEVPKYLIIENLMILKESLLYGTWELANQECQKSRIGRYSDWRLPTNEEWEMIFEHLYEHKDLFETFVDENRGPQFDYWSSTLAPSTQFINKGYYHIGFYWSYTQNDEIKYHWSFHYNSDPVYSCRTRAVRTIK